MGHLSDFSKDIIIPSLSVLLKICVKFCQKSSFAWIFFSLHHKSVVSCMNNRSQGCLIYTKTWRHLVECLQWMQMRLLKNGINHLEYIIYTHKFVFQLNGSSSSNVLIPLQSWREPNLISVLRGWSVIYFKHIYDYLLFFYLISCFIRFLFI